LPPEAAQPPPGGSAAARAVNVSIDTAAIRAARRCIASTLHRLDAFAIDSRLSMAWMGRAQSARRSAGE
jgi:hypothetical protein